MTNFSLKISSFAPWVGIRNISDYSPFGVLLPERMVEGAFYRNGFQGQERDDEVKGEENSVNFSYRMHDSRVARFFTRDPLAFEYPHNSPYAFSENRVIDAFELEGLESVCFNGSTWHDYDGKSTSRIAKALNWVESAHQGHLSAERVQNWKESWYVTVDNERDYWGRSTGTTLKFYNNRQDWLDDKPFKTVTERDIFQTFFSWGDGSELEGNHDPAAQGGWGGNKEKDIKYGLTTISAIVAIGTGGVSLLAEGVTLSAGTGLSIAGVANSIDDLTGLADDNGITTLQKLVGEETGSILKLSLSFVGSKKALIDYVNNVDDATKSSISIISFVNDQGNTYYGVYQKGNKTNEED